MSFHSGSPGASPGYGVLSSVSSSLASSTPVPHFPARAPPARAMVPLPPAESASVPASNLATPSRARAMGGGPRSPHQRKPPLSSLVTYTQPAAAAAAAAAYGGVASPPVASTPRVRARPSGTHPYPEGGLGGMASPAAVAASRRLQHVRTVRSTPTPARARGLASPLSAQSPSRTSRLSPTHGRPAPAVPARLLVVSPSRLRAARARAHARAQQAQAHAVGLAEAPSLQPTPATVSAAAAAEDAAAAVVAAVAVAAAVPAPSPVDRKSPSAGQRAAKAGVGAGAAAAAEAKSGRVDAGPGRVRSPVSAHTAHGRAPARGGLRAPFATAGSGSSMGTGTGKNAAVGSPVGSASAQVSSVVSSIVVEDDSSSGDNDSASSSSPSPPARVRAHAHAHTLAHGHPPLPPFPPRALALLTVPSVGALRRSAPPGSDPCPPLLSLASAVLAAAAGVPRSAPTAPVFAAPTPDREQHGRVRIPAPPTVLPVPPLAEILAPSQLSSLGALGGSSNGRVVRPWLLPVFEARRELIAVLANGIRARPAACARGPAPAQPAAASAVAVAALAATAAVASPLPGTPPLLVRVTAASFAALYARTAAAATALVPPLLQLARAAPGAAPAAAAAVAAAGPAHRAGANTAAPAATAAMIGGVRMGGAVAHATTCAHGLASALRQVASPGISPAAAAAAIANWACAFFPSLPPADAAAVAAALLRPGPPAPGAAAAASRVVEAAQRRMPRELFKGALPSSSPTSSSSSSSQLPLLGSSRAGGGAPWLAWLLPAAADTAVSGGLPPAGAAVTAVATALCLLVVARPLAALVRNRRVMAATGAGVAELMGLPWPADTGAVAPDADVVVTVDTACVHAETAVICAASHPSLPTSVAGDTSDSHGSGPVTFSADRVFSKAAYLPVVDSLATAVSSASAAAGGDGDGGFVAAAAAVLAPLLAAAEMGPEAGLTAAAVAAAVAGIASPLAPASLPAFTPASAPASAPTSAGQSPMMSPSSSPSFSGSRTRSPSYDVTSDTDTGSGAGAGSRGRAASNAHRGRVGGTVGITSLAGEPDGGIADLIALLRRRTATSAAARAAARVSAAAEAAAGAAAAARAAGLREAESDIIDDLRKGGRRVSSSYNAHGLLGQSTPLATAAHITSHTLALGRAGAGHLSHTPTVPVRPLALAAELTADPLRPATPVRSPSTPVRVLPLRVPVVPAYAQTPPPRSPSALADERIHVPDPGLGLGLSHEQNHGHGQFSIPNSSAAVGQSVSVSAAASVSGSLRGTSLAPSPSTGVSAGPGATPGPGPGAEGAGAGAGAGRGEGGSGVSTPGGDGTGAGSLLPHSPPSGASAATQASSTFAARLGHGSGAGIGAGAVDVGSEIFDHDDDDDVGRVRGKVPMGQRARAASSSVLSSPVRPTALASALAAAATVDPEPVCEIPTQAGAASPRAEDSGSASLVPEQPKESPARAESIASTLASLLLPASSCRCIPSCTAVVPIPALPQLRPRFLGSSGAVELAEGLARVGEMLAREGVKVLAPLPEENKLVDKVVAASSGAVWTGGIVAPLRNAAAVVVMPVALPVPASIAAPPSFPCCAANCSSVSEGPPPSPAALRALLLTASTEVSSAHAPLARAALHTLAAVANRVPLLHPGGAAEEGWRLALWAATATPAAAARWDLVGGLTSIPDPITATGVGAGAVVAAAASRGRLITLPAPIPGAYDLTPLALVPFNALLGKSDDPDASISASARAGLAALLGGLTPLKAVALLLTVTTHIASAGAAVPAVVPPPVGAVASATAATAAEEAGVDVGAGAGPMGAGTRGWLPGIAAVHPSNSYGNVVAVPMTAPAPASTASSETVGGHATVPAPWAAAPAPSKELRALVVLQLARAIDGLFGASAAAARLAVAVDAAVTAQLARIRSDQPHSHVCGRDCELDAALFLLLKAGYPLPSALLSALPAPVADSGTGGAVGGTVGGTVGALLRGAGPLPVVAAPWTLGDLARARAFTAAHSHLITSEAAAAVAAASSPLRIPLAPAAGSSHAAPLSPLIAPLLPRLLLTVTRACAGDSAPLRAAGRLALCALADGWGRPAAALLLARWGVLWPSARAVAAPSAAPLPLGALPLPAPLPAGAGSAERAARAAAVAASSAAAGLVCLGAAPLLSLPSATALLSPAARHVLERLADVTAAVADAAVGPHAQVAALVSDHHAALAAAATAHAAAAEADAAAERAKRAPERLRAAAEVRAVRARAAADEAAAAAAEAQQASDAAAEEAAGALSGSVSSAGARSLAAVMGKLLAVPTVQVRAEAWADLLPLSGSGPAGALSSTSGWAAAGAAAYPGLLPPFVLRQDTASTARAPSLDSLRLLEAAQTPQHARDAITAAITAATRVCNQEESNSLLSQVAVHDHQQQVSPAAAPAPREEGSSAYEEVSFCGHDDDASSRSSGGLAGRPGLSLNRNRDRIIGAGHVLAGAESSSASSSDHGRDSSGSLFGSGVALNMDAHMRDMLTPSRTQPASSSRSVEPQQQQQPRQPQRQRGYAVYPSAAVNPDASSDSWRRGMSLAPLAVSSTALGSAPAPLITPHLPRRNSLSSTAAPPSQPAHPDPRGPVVEPVVLSRRSSLSGGYSVHPPQTPRSTARRSSLTGGGAVEAGAGFARRKSLADSVGSGAGAGAGASGGVSTGGGGMSIGGDSEVYSNHSVSIASASGAPYPRRVSGGQFTDHAAAAAAATAAVAAHKAAVRVQPDSRNHSRTSSVNGSSSVFGPNSGLGESSGNFADSNDPARSSKHEPAKVQAQMQAQAQVQGKDKDKDKDNVKNKDKDKGKDQHSAKAQDPASPPRSRRGSIAPPPSRPSSGAGSMFGSPLYASPSGSTFGDGGDDGGDGVLTDERGAGHLGWQTGSYHWHSRTPSVSSRVSNATPYEERAAGTGFAVIGIDIATIPARSPTPTPSIGAGDAEDERRRRRSFSGAAGVEALVRVGTPSRTREKHSML